MRNPKIAVSYGRYIIGNERFAAMIRRTASADITTRIFSPKSMPAPRMSRYQRALIEAAAAVEAASGGAPCTTCTVLS